MPLLDLQTISTTPSEYLHSHGRVFAFFGANTQDSGNESFGVEVDAIRFFVKTPGFPDAPLAHPNSPTHQQRIDALRNAVALRRTVDHPGLPVLHKVIESPIGPMLVYEWVYGEHLGRAGDATGNRRFKLLPADEIRAALDTIYEVHVRLEQAGYVACDFYDGALIYDFDRRRIYLVDLDIYHRGPFTNRMGRMFGSSKFLAPEEFELGAAIDHRTTVFTMGRTAAMLWSDGTLDRAPFRGSDAQYHVMLRACRPDPYDRYLTVAAFREAWTAAKSSG